MCSHSHGPDLTTLKIALKHDCEILLKESEFLDQWSHFSKHNDLNGIAENISEAKDLIRSATLKLEDVIHGIMHLQMEHHDHGHGNNSDEVTIKPV